MIQVQNHHTPCTWMPTIYIDWQCHKSCLSVAGFKWRNDKFKFFKDSIENYDGSDKDTPLKLMLIILGNYRRHIASILPSLPEKD